MPRKSRIELRKAADLKAQQDAANARYAPLIACQELLPQILRYQRHYATALEHEWTPTELTELGLPHIELPTPTPKQRRTKPKPNLNEHTEPNVEHEQHQVEPTQPNPDEHTYYTYE